MSRPPAQRLGAATRAVPIAAQLDVLWRFSRPHTVIGTTVSVLALYAIASAAGHGASAADLAATLFAAWCVNVAIVGLNQLEDVEIDRINKPWLPVASGELAIASARRIVVATTAAPIALALTQGPIELVAVLAALAAGAAYSSPPVRLKRFPFAAATTIAGVRALAVNLGVYGHFAGSLAQVPDAVWALTAFSLPFSVGIALLKDVPDVEGDARHRIRTLSVRLGPRRVFAAACALLVVTYVSMAIAGAMVVADVSRPLFVTGHLAALALLLGWAARADPADRVGFPQFYLRIWQLFFCEYVLVALSFLAVSG